MRERAGTRGWELEWWVRRDDWCGAWGARMDVWGERGWPMRDIERKTWGKEE